MSDLAGKATALLTMHDDFVVLPTAWDAWSARTLVDAGFEALTIGSHPLAESRGQGDNEGMSLDDALEGIARITASVDVPVSADMESGYGAAPAELIERLLEAGAVGLNVEDTVHAEGRMREPQEHADYIAGLRAAADAAGVEVVINARTDAFARPHLHGRDPLEEAIARCELMEQAGARSLYPVVPPSRAAIGAILERVSLPVNVTAHPVRGSIFGDLAATREGGARRVSFGPLLQAALTDLIGELARPWR
ncbi:isocitrate lyase/phosphoenolpyruvate mutase family protein [Agrococcus sp. TF02-05]|uniref:isocitrate lyase/PEP mutase family protein n=1 Tax=Agrococcus sp. TF02-05 TaxID=2815211 RepID=UPI001AA1A962|nr:isocitrate lyase/phosphoenolpyruvate mutase family protein [Agrococcus sp. TF02-05]MBO1768745.1 isocitrate lyase/phosphoenolpyruvate mutase family protein [Agrococcus sp. TF02-05]